jgi:hypothetical protein
VDIIDPMSFLVASVEARHVAVCPQNRVIASEIQNFDMRGDVAGERLFLPPEPHLTHPRSSPHLVRVPNLSRPVLNRSRAFPSQ